MAVLRVPLILAAPGLPEGRRVTCPVRHVDVLPTVLDLLDLPPAPQGSGSSLLPAVASGEDCPEVPIIAESPAYGADSKVVIWKRRKLIVGVRRPTAAVVLQLPFWEPLGLLLRERLRAPLVSDRLELHTAFPGVPPVVEQGEERLLRAADRVTSSSPDLLTRSQSAARRTLLLPNATSLSDFPPAPTPPCGEVVVGYVGALGPWVDAGALAAAARAHPYWRFELAGRVESEEIAALARLPNLRLPGEIRYRDVTGFFGRLHAALVPFRDLPLPRAVDPVKLYEALAVGVPVVAAALPGAASWEESLVYLYRRPEELPRALEAIAADDAASRLRRRQAVGRRPERFGRGASSRRSPTWVRVSARRADRPGAAHRRRTGPFTPRRPLTGRREAATARPTSLRTSGGSRRTGAGTPLLAGHRTRTVPSGG